MKECRPDTNALLGAITLANRAPSVRNPQPWRWLLGDESVHVMADRSRDVPVNDPDRRDLLLSCGPALGALGWRAVVHRLPNTADPDQTDRRRFSSWAVPDGHLDRQLLDVLGGDLVAIGLSILDLPRRVARPHDGILGEVPGLAGMHDVEDHPRGQTSRSTHHRGRRHREPLHGPRAENT